jgi:hypothetical protein
MSRVLRIQLRPKVTTETAGGGHDRLALRAAAAVCTQAIDSKQFLNGIVNVSDVCRGIRAVGWVRRILVVVTGKTIEGASEVAVRPGLKRFHGAVG